MEYELLTSMLNCKLGLRKEYFFYVLDWLWIESPKNPIPLLYFCVKKLNHDFEINLRTYGRFFHGFITRAI